MTRRNSFAPHLPKPALLPLLVLLALPPCTSQAGFLQEFYDDASLQSSYTAPTSFNFFQGRKLFPTNHWVNSVFVVKA